MPASKRVRILDGASVQRTVQRMAHEILERNRSVDEFALVGIHTRGVPLANRLAAVLATVEGLAPRVGSLDINLYRDDLSSREDHPVLRKTEIDFAVDDLNVVLVDDVLYTGRTIRAALGGLTDLGRPRWIQLAVLIDRGHRELPIRADFVGKTVSTTREQIVEVRLRECDGIDEVVIANPMEP